MYISRGWPHTQPPPASVELNRNSPQAKGLLIWTPFSGVYQHSFGAFKNFTHRTGDGTSFGDPTWEYDSEIGPYVNLPGTSSGFDWGDLAAVEGINQITISAWARKSVAWGQDIIWAKHTGSTNGCFYLATTNSTTARCTIINAASSRVDHDATFSFATNTWYLFVGVYDGIDIKIYINGIHYGTPSAQTGNIKNHSSTLRFGHYNGSFWELEGGIAEPRIYDRALSAGEVWTMYDPATRWDLYKPILQTFWSIPIAAAPFSGAHANLKKKRYQHMLNR